MPISPEVRAVLDAVESAAPMSAQQTPAAFRQGLAALSTLSTREEVASVTDRMIRGPGGDLSIRVYIPAAASGSGQGAPALVWFHGGGWIAGDLETHDSLCRSLANAAEVAVISVDYRLAPEHPFPAAVEDALASVRWVAASAGELGIDATRLAVGGDSAGGNLTAVVCQSLRDTGPAIRFQVIAYAGLDLRFETASMTENADGYWLTRDALFWLRHLYCGERGADLVDPHLSPACAPDVAISGLPPVLVITAEYDPLRDDGEAYAKRLRAAGVDTTVRRYDGMIHGFLSMADVLPEGRLAIQEAAAAVRAALA